ncbi:MAG: PAS domain S-box protein [Vicinamibacterales bacterium]
MFQDPHEAQARLAAIVESSDDAIISKDLNGVITSWNAGAERLFGYTPSEAIGQPITFLIPAGRHHEEPGILRRIRRGERIAHFETVRMRKDGTYVDISLTVSPILDGNGIVIGASKVARDISERKRAEEQRENLLRMAQASREEAEHANRAKDEFLAMLGHELRNPLAAVRMAIAAATLDDASRTRALEIAQRQTEQLGRIVDDLLDVARITRGQVRLRKSPVVLGELLQRVVEASRSLVDERSHVLTVLPEAESIHLEADAARIEQAVSNLLTNAAKYTDPGGMITVSSAREGSEAVIRVHDTGIGIAPEVLPRVFDLFAQGERTLDRSEGGLGIGLTLVRRIVELHDGTVHAASPGLGQGAEFVLRLPALPGPAVATPSRLPVHERQEQALKTARVLVVEDNQDAAEMLAMLLDVLGHEVQVLPDGPAALEAARVNRPDIMIIDIGLPGMNGYEVARALRCEPALRSVVLVALTGYGQAEDKARALAAGFDHHLVKPVDVEVLSELLGKVGSSPA